MTGPALPRRVADAASVLIDRIRDRDAQQGMDRNQPVFRFGMAVVAGRDAEIILRVAQTGVGDPGRVALFAGHEVVLAGRIDDERGPLRARRPAAVNADALEDIPGMAEQALRSRDGRRTPVRSGELRFMRRPQIDRLRSSRQRLVASG